MSNISNQLILEEVDKWMQSKDAQRIQDLQRPVTIVKRHDSSHTSYRKLSLVDAIGRVVLLDYVFCEKKGKEFIKDYDSIKKVKTLLNILN